MRAVLWEGGGGGALLYFVSWCKDDVIGFFQDVNRA